LAVQVNVIIKKEQSQKKFRKGGHGGKRLRNTDVGLHRYFIALQWLDAVVLILLCLVLHETAK
jgi:hypothetical protein